MWEKKIQFLAGLLVLVLIAFMFSGTVAFRASSMASPSPSAESMDAEKEDVVVNENLVVLDAGHGGVDPGKIGVNDALEKDINLQIVYYLKEYLEEQGIEVVLTREDDEGLYSRYSSNKKTDDMQKRCAVIKEANPAIAVSVHQNSYHEGGVQGAQVFYYTKSKEGKKLAETIQGTLIAEIDASNTRTAKANDNYYMLRRTVAPTVIVECGFLSNWEEAQMLITEDYQKKMARAICNGILRYMGKIH